jgi:hypothetical protein
VTRHLRSVPVTGAPADARIVFPVWTPNDLVEIVGSRVIGGWLTAEQGEREIARIRAAAPIGKPRPAKITPAQIEAVQDRTRENLNRATRKREAAESAPKPERSKGRSR